MHSYASQNLVKLCANLRTIPEALYRRFNSLVNDGALKTKRTSDRSLVLLALDCWNIVGRQRTRWPPAAPEIDRRTRRRMSDAAFPQTGRIRRFPGGRYSPDLLGGVDSPLPPAPPLLPGASGAPPGCPPVAPDELLDVSTADPATALSPSYSTPFT